MADHIDLCRYSYGDAREMGITADWRQSFHAKQAFKDWIWKDQRRRERLCKLYNEKFNSIRPREYDGGHLQFPGMNPEIALRSHQVNAIARIIYGGNTLLAHVVGAGKTFEMVAASQKLKQVGLCHKSLFVVPNHITEQWATEYLQLYPSANILVATAKDFETKNRKRFCGRIATGDYDAIIIGHSQFEKIPMFTKRTIKQRIVIDHVDTASEALAASLTEKACVDLGYMGRMWTDGLGRSPDTEEARRWYEKALAAFHAVEARRPDRYTEYRIGKLYAAGLGPEQDHVEAARWFGMAADKNHKYAQYSLAGLYLRGQGVDQDDAEAFRLCSKSAAQGFPYAAFELGRLLRDGRGCEQDTAAAAGWFASAYQGFLSLERQSHDDKLQYRLGWMLLHGVGVAADESAAREWFEESARLDNPYAQYQLAKLILSDENAGTEEIGQAVAWLTKSAQAGQDCAQYALGKLYRDGRGVEKDVLQAVIWLSAAAEQDNSCAAYALGRLYLDGGNVPKDVTAALRWLLRSAELGNQHAQYRLGKLYLAGEDVPKDTIKALEYLTAAAKQGDQYAQYTLGKLYLLGREVERDEAAAVYWFTQSAGQGNEYAQWFLDHRNKFQGPTPFQCATRLLHHMSRIFQEQTPRPPAGLRIEVDSKLRRRIREKKIAMGHKPDDHEQRM